MDLTLESLKRFEIKKCGPSRGHPNPEGDPGLTAHLARVDQAKLRLSEALCRVNSVHPVHRARSALAIGDLLEADAQLSSLPALDAEILLEHARLSVFQGKWAQAKSQCLQALSIRDTGRASPVTEMTIRQVLSVATYNLGEIEDSEREVNLALTLGELFPGAQSLMYARIHLARVYFAKNESHLGREALDAAWESALSGKSPKLDPLIPLLQAERLDPKSCFVSSKSAYSEYLIAKAKGELLYQGLALRDFLALCPNAAPSYHKELAHLQSKFERLRAEPRSPVTLPYSIWLPDPHHTTKSILIAKHQVWIDLSSLKVRKIALTPQMVRAAKLLSLGPIESESFFIQIWNIHSYNPEKHGGAVRALIKRLRKLFGPLVNTTDGKIQLEATLVIDL